MRLLLSRAKIYPN